MIIYLLLIFLPILFYYFSVRLFPKDRRGRISITIFFAIFLFMLMFRDETVGRDVANYHWIFSKISHTEWSSLAKSNIELGFVYLNKLISSMGGNFRFLLAVSSLITIIPIWLLYRNETEDSPTEIAVFINMSTFLVMFSGMRQAIAVSIGIIAFTFVKRKKLIFFIITVLVAIAFHSSAFVLFLMYPIYFIRLKKIMLPIVAAIIGVIFIFNRPIFSFLSVFISDAHNADKSITSTGAYSMIILLVLFAVFSFIIPDEGNMSTEGYGLRNLLLISIVIQLFAPVNFLAMRMNYYFLIFIPLLLSKVVSHPSLKWRQVSFLGKHVIILAMLISFFIISVRQNALDTFPYKFCW